MTARNVAYGDFGHAKQRSLELRHWLQVAGIPLVVWLVGEWAITQWLAHRLDFQSGLGQPLLYVLGTPAYPPLAWRGWMDTLAVASTSSLPRWTRFAGQAVMSVSALVGMKVYATLRRRLLDRSGELHGSAHFATPDEVDASGMLTPEGVIVGSWHDPRSTRLRYLWHNGPAHLLLVAPTRTGKGVGAVLPTLITWRHSLVCLDPKDENFDLTSGWRSEFSTTMRLNWAIDPERTAHYNPLAEVRIGQPLEIRDVQLAAESLIGDAKGGSDDANHFVVTGRRLLATAMLHVLYRERRNSRVATLAQVAKELAAYASPNDAARQWAAEPYPEAAAWCSSAGSEHVVGTGRALAAQQPVLLAAAFENAGRLLALYIENLEGPIREGAVPVEFGHQNDLPSVQAIVAKVAADTSATGERAILRGAALHIGYRRARRGECALWSDWLAEVRCERRPRDIALSWKDYPHDASQPWITANGVDFIRVGASQ